MTIIAIAITMFLGMSMLVIGLTTKRRWLIIISVSAIVAALIQIIILLSMAFV